MKIKLLFYSACLLFLVAGSNVAKAQSGIAYPQNKEKPLGVIYSSGKVENYKIRAINRKKSGEKPTAVFEVNYDGFSEEAKTAFAQAINLWSYLVKSTVPIKVNAKWEPLDTGVLGAAGPESYRRNFKNAPLNDVWYPIVIANKLAGYDIEPEAADIGARFSSTFNWYLGIDGNCPSNQHDFVSVVMHEIGHGLGFVGSASVAGIIGSWGLDTGFPFIYDIFVENANGAQIVNEGLFENPSTSLKIELTSPLFFNSELSNAANENEVVELYSPATWDNGSSFAHLGETFNATPNALMTYSSGTGEVSHHPGPITLAMFAEMGWVSVLFDHQPIVNMEAMVAPVDVNVNLFSDSAIVAGSAKLHYSIDDFETETVVELTTTNDTLYTAAIPVVAADTISYYLEVTNNLDRTYYYPAQGTDEVTEITNVFKFGIGTDEEGPEIFHQPISNVFNFDKYLNIEFGATDNMGVAEAYVEYKVNDGDLMELECEFVGYTAELDLYSFETTINVEDLLDGDNVFYRIKALDVAQVTNTTILPADDFFKVGIVDIGEPITEAIITFDEAGDESLFIESGIIVDQPDGFSDKALHTPHPYPEGEPYPTDDIEFSTMMKSPVIISETDAFIKFDEIVIVEPGDNGSVYGNDNFWDYVVVEGSKDRGATWNSFEDGWDCTHSTLFTNAYNSNLNGSESMYAEHTIDLLASDNFSAKDTVLVRFRLYSDQLTFGWGWAVDNVQVQTEIISVNENSFTADFKLYPNPAKGAFNLSINSNEVVENYTVNVYNVIGELVYILSDRAASKSVNKFIDIANQPSGVYFVKFNAGNNTLMKKIVLE